MVSPSRRALRAVFTAAGWAYLPDLDTFSRGQRDVWKAAAVAVDIERRKALEEAAKEADKWEPARGIGFRIRALVDREPSDG